MVVVEVTMNRAHPLLADCGVELLKVVPCDAPPVLETKTRLIESVALVTVLLAASFTHTVIVDWDAPFAGIGLGDAVATRRVAAPVPVNEIVVEEGVRPVDVAVAVHASAMASPIVNFTVVPVGAVFALAGLPEPPAGVVPVTEAPQTLPVLGWNIVSVRPVGPKTLVPPASWTCTVRSHVEPAVCDVVGVLLQVLPVITSFEAGPDALTVAVADPEPRPAPDAVTVHVPGEPVVVSVALALLEPAGIVTLVRETLHTPPLSTLKLTVCALCAFAVTPLASFSVAVAVLVRALPDGNSF